MDCKVYELSYLKDYKYVVIIATHKDRWVLCKHKKRDTWETAGGHIESGETPLDAAKRKLFEALPSNLTYMGITPKLFQHYENNFI